LAAGALGIGGGIGAAVARKMAITDLPQMVAAFHSLVNAQQSGVQEKNALRVWGGGLPQPVADWQ
jgi:NAD/NADP transhydrogenase beta subunit